MTQTPGDLLRANRKPVPEQGLETGFLQANKWTEPASSICCTGLWHWPGTGQSHPKQVASLEMERKGDSASALPVPGCLSADP